MMGMTAATGWWWLLFIVMFVVVVAAVTAVTMVLARGGRRQDPAGHGPQQDRGPGQAGEDPVTVLRERYARGEIGHDEFERYLDHLVRTEPPSARWHDGERD